MAGPGGGYKSGKQRSVSPSRFAMVPRNDIPRSAFDVSHTHKTTFNAGFLVPVFVDEVLPGDSFRVRMTAFARLATPIVPIMDNLIMETFWFFCPNRLLWSNWERFMGEQASPTDTTVFLVPQYVSTTDAAGSLRDYMGIFRNFSGESVSVNALPFRAYNLIWNEWFRDQDLQAPVVVDLDEGPDAQGDYELKRRGKRHDYFTTARPWPQKPIQQDTLSVIAPYPANYVPGGNMAFGDRAYGIGAPVTGIGVDPIRTPLTGPFTTQNSGDRTFNYGWAYPGDEIVMRAVGGGAPDVRVMVNDIRTAVMVQRMLELGARGGTRYTELVWNEFRVTSPDARLQRPEYLGGGRTMVTVNPVAQTSATRPTDVDQTTVLGELAGVGTAVATNHGFSQSFTEHGVILGLMCVRADMTYQQGINRMWYRKTQYDFYRPSLAHLGEQAIFTKELYCTGDGVGSLDNQVFGYQERWSEYKYKPNRVSGAFRSDDPAGSLDVWHLGQFFGEAPVLNPAFIEENPPVERVLQVATTESFHFLLDSLFDCRLVRAMPMFSIPGLGARL